MCISVLSHELNVCYPGIHNSCTVCISVLSNELNVCYPGIYNRCLLLLFTVIVPTYNNVLGTF